MEPDERIQTSILVRRAVEGDRPSLERVIAHLSPLVEAQIRYKLGALGRNAADVEDLVAEVWTRVLLHVEELRPREGHHAPVLASYLSTTATNLCNNFLRKAFRRRGTAPRGREEESAGVPELAAETRSLMTRVCEREVTALIRAALERLPEEKRRIVLLRLMEHRSTVEIAALLELKPNTVAVQYRRAIDELRQALPASVVAELKSLCAGRSQP